MEVFIYIILAIGAWGMGDWMWRRWQQKKRGEAYATWKLNQKHTVLKVLVPKNNEKTPLAAEQLFAALHGIYREKSAFQEQISFEIVAFDQFVHFFIHVPASLRDFVEGQIYAQYPLAEIYETDDYVDAVKPEMVKVGTELVLNKNEVYPIKTFQNFEVDPLSAITGVLSSVSAGESLWLQCVISPVGDEWHKQGVSLVGAIRAGKSLKKSGPPIQFLARLASVFLAIFKFIFQAPQASLGGGEEGAASGDAKKGDASKTKLSAPEEAAMSAIEEKVTKLGFKARIRLVASSADEYRAKAKMESLIGVFKQFNTTNLNGFTSGLVEGGEEVVRKYKTRDLGLDGGSILNTEELASFYHLPAKSVETPSIVWAGSKKGEPPADLPIEGQADPSELTYFGYTNFRSSQHKFGIKRKDRRLHMYAIGKTGTGKSTLLFNMILNDILKGEGIAVIDPHGQLISDVIGQIPEERIKDVVYFNPADADWPVAFNVLENVNPALKNIIVSGVVGIFKKLWADSWGPRLEYILRNAILALMEYQNSTLLDVMRLLIDTPFRKEVITAITDPVVKDFFVNEYNRWQEKFRLESIQSIQNKVGQFLSSVLIRNIIGQPISSINLRKIMDERKILLVDLAIGKIGEDTSALLGAMMITKIQLDAMGRADVAESQRPDFYLYVDEFQNFATESFAVILSEARKYHLNLTLTNQYIAQIPEEVKDAIFGNVGSIISFRVGATDASAMTQEFAPVFEPNDMVNLPNYQVYVKMAVDGVTRPAFSAKTLPPIAEEGIEGHKKKIIEVSRESYGHSREEVEKAIIERSQSSKSGEGKSDFQDIKEISDRGDGPSQKPPIRDEDASNKVIGKQNNQEVEFFFVDKPLTPKTPDKKDEHAQGREVRRSDHQGTKEQPHSGSHHKPTREHKVIDLRGGGDK